MGQGHSEPEKISIEQLSIRLTQRFASKCFSSLEIYSFTHNFRALASTTSSSTDTIRHWDESTLCRFLSLPDALGVGSIVYQMATYLGAFPFPSQAPAILTFEALVRVVVIMTERYRAVIKRGRQDWLREIYRSVAVYDRRASRSLSLGNAEAEKSKAESIASGEKSTQGFAIDAPVEDEGGGEDEDDELALAAFESMDAIDAFRHGDKANIHHSIIPTDNFRKLVQLMLLIAPLDEQDDLSTFFAQLTDERLESLRETSNNILASFDIEDSPGITYRTFDRVVSTALPHLFDGLNALFSHFLFAKDLDLSKRKASTTSHEPEEKKPSPPPTGKPEAHPEPPLLNPGAILDLNLLSQLSFIFPPSSLFRRLRPLYSGSTNGFSMGSFEKCVFNWRAPTILLISGTILPSSTRDPQCRNFLESLPPQRYPSSGEEGQDVVYGAYIPQPWKQTHKTPFGDSETLLFMLAPKHAVFLASSGSDYIYFSPGRQSSPLPGLGLGTPIPIRKPPLLPLGPVSLHLDDGLEFGVFTHLKTGGGTFSPVQWMPEFQDRFEISDIEVWGCGGDEEAEKQRAAWKWEEGEAERRRRINLGGTGDVEADRELLRMAGLIGGERSGGSMG